MEKLQGSYIGIPAVLDESEVTRIKELYGHGHSHLLMIEAWVCERSLWNEDMAPELRRRFPDPMRLSRIFSDDDRVLNIVRCGTEGRRPLEVYRDLIRIHHLAGRNLNGFMFDGRWPDPRILSRYRSHVDPRARMMLRLDVERFESLKYLDRSFDQVMERYVDAATDIVIDPSSHPELAFDAHHAGGVLVWLMERYPSIRIGISGFRTATTIRSLADLAAIHPHLSLAAGTAFRNKLNTLDERRIQSYFREAQALLMAS